MLIGMSFFITTINTPGITPAITPHPPPITMGKKHPPMGLSGDSVCII
jgi:hypothetical protein